MWKTSRAGGGARGSAEIMGAGGGTVGSTVGELWLGELWLGGGILRSMPCGWDMASWRSEVGILRVGELAPCRSEICGLGLGAWGLPFAIWGWGLRFGRHDVACCLRFGPESGLGFRIWGLGFGRWGLTVCGFGWGLQFVAGICGSRFAACCLEVAIRGWGLGFAVWGGRMFTVLPGGWGLRLGFAARGLQLAVWRLRFEVGSAVWRGRKFTVLAGVCGLNAVTWLAVCDSALRAV